MFRAFLFFTEGYKGLDFAIHIGSEDPLWFDGWLRPFGSAFGDTEEEALANALTKYRQMILEVFEEVPELGIPSM